MASSSGYAVNSLHAKPISLPKQKSDLQQWSFFFDLDGTLLDLAPTPDAVRAEEGLLDTLQKLAEYASGAVAIVTGRSIDFVDQLFPDHRFIVAGLHGSTIRLSAEPATDPHSDLPEAFVAAREFTKHSVPDHSQILFEDKGRAFTLHYRLAPECEALVREIMTAALEIVGNEFVLQEGKFVIELKPASGNKGTAVETLLQNPLFQNRRPFAAGDDITDEAMFEAVNMAGGASMRIGAVSADVKTAAQFHIDSPADFRLWIRSLAE